MIASRQKTENRLRREALNSIRNSLKEMVLRSSPDRGEIHSFSGPTVGEETIARMELMRRQAKSYDLILQILEKLTNGMKEGVDFHCDEGRLVRSPNLIRAIDDGNEDVAKLLAIDHLINYIRHGKITFHRSYYYQDLGARIKKVSIGRDEGFLNSEILEQLISGTFPVNIWLLYDAIAYCDGDEGSWQKLTIP